MKVREAEDLESLRANWNDLARVNLLGDNIFLTWEWLSTWWKHFGEGRKPLVLVVEDNARIIGIAPLMLSKYKLPGFGIIKKIEFLGVRTSDYSNFIILEKPTDCLKLIIDYLLNSVRDWHWIELREIPESVDNCVSLDILFSYLPNNLKFEKRVCEICPYVTLPKSFETLVKGLSRNMRQNLNKYLRRINEKYRLELKRYDEIGYSVKEGMELFIKLNEKRWASEGLLGSFSSKEDSFRRFHMEVAELFAQKGWLGLYFLTANGNPISAQYTFEYREKMFYYLAGFDPQYASYSIGNLMISSLLERCIKQGFKEYDMMRGDESYKILWTSTTRRNFEVKYVRKGLYSAFLNWATSNEATRSIADKLKLSLKKNRYS